MWVYRASDCLSAGLYIGWYTGDYNPWSLSGMGCPSADYSHTFLALWGEAWTGSTHDIATSHPSRVTALFCEPSYWVQSANVTIDAANKSVLSAIPLEDRFPLTSDHFNISNFRVHHRCQLKREVPTGRHLSDRAGNQSDKSINESRMESCCNADKHDGVCAGHNAIAYGAIYERDKPYIKF